MRKKTVEHTLKALAVAALLLLPASAARAAADPNVAHIDGYIVDDRHGCRILRDHEGKIYSLVEGDSHALRNGDHVRLEGTFTRVDRCRQGSGFALYLVQTVWADDRHRTTYYDHLRNRSFNRWAERNGRYDRRGH